MCAHLAALAAAIVVPAMVPGALPAPMRALAWVRPVIVSLPDIPIPPEPFAYPLIQVMRRAVQKSDRNGGRDGILLKLAGLFGVGFDS